MTPHPHATPWPLEFDVAVIGGGPAGCSAAAALARGGRAVAIVCPTGNRPPGQDPPAAAVPVETLRPEAAAALDALGLIERFAAVPRVPCPGTRSAWGSPEPADVDHLFDPLGHPWHVDRRAFHAMMFRGATDAGATAVAGTAVGLAAEPDGRWAVAIGGRPAGSGVGRPPARTVRCRWVVDATGRARAFARLVQPGTPADRAPCRRRDPLVAVVALVAARQGTADRRLLVEAADVGWWYAAPSPGGGLVVALVTDHDLIPRGPAAARAFDRALAATKLVGPAAGPRAGHGVRIRPAGGHWWGAAPASRILAVGDAAVPHDPIAGRGVAWALASGCRAAVAVVDGDGAATAQTASARYVAETSAYAEAYHATRALTYASAARRWPRHPFWTRRLGPASGIPAGGHSPPPPGST